MNPRRSARWRLAIAFALAAIPASGCGRDDPSNRVKGVVRLDGKALPSGTVSFWGRDGSQVFAPISPEGEYQIANVPEGEASIAVFPDSPNPFAVKPPPRRAGAGQTAVGDQPVGAIGFPERYTDPERSGLTWRVEKGDQTFNIDLKKP
jgi:hypothetical protein